jgi:hypothetical protein
MFFLAWPCSVDFQSSPAGVEAGRFFLKKVPGGSRFFKKKIMTGRLLSYEHALLPSSMKATGPTILQAETCVSAFQVDETTSGSKRYVFIMVLTALYVCAEIFVALYTNSLALLSDAFHNLGDVGALFIAMYCEKVF